MPVLARGRHRRPERGACFLEYTALLAGEPFGDAPACVDAELAAVLRHANDVLSAADRPRLVPLLGRAIGLAVPAGEGGQAAAVARLRRAAARHLTDALGVRPAPALWRACRSGRDVDRLFWSLMSEPEPVRTSAAWVDRLLDRLVLLHGCYEQAMVEPAVAGAVRPAG
ncbi:hypothetical protein SAMN06893096_102249 [Geodermatophilus pulveris]|uniref:Uncharacterized protein n=1 Tax=Geodermatophilus pulveris TaxID=1564159 RepID=A0A239C5H6_9ACTN|nr:hypothetical protein [Geodermatophilus pulveris]SNS15159.1 hypothetical protein SAMN06893096_102249 [Geodermatophilus pulveris]